MNSYIKIWFYILLPFIFFSFILLFYILFWFFFLFLKETAFSIPKEIENRSLADIFQILKTFEV